MDELILMYAKIIPEDELLKKMSEALEKYRILKDEESKKFLVLYVILFSSKMQIEEKGIEVFLKEFSQRKETERLFKNKNN